MPALRPASYLRYGGYVCQSCIAKLQAPRKHPWLIRNAATQARQNGPREHVRQNKTQPAAQTPDNTFVVRRFEESSDGTVETLDDDFGEDTIEKLKSRVAALEAHVQTFRLGDLAREKAFINQLLSSKGAPYGAPLQPFSSGEYPNSSLANLSLEDMEIPLKDFPNERCKNILKLNQVIRNFALQHHYSWSNVRDLWKWYTLCRRNLILARELVPSAVWKVLWEAFSRPSVENVNRMAHIRQLAEDMKAAGVRLDRPQTLLYLKSLFYVGKHKEAMNQWESEQADLAYYPSTTSQYWELGVRMLANDNQPERAQQATDLLMNEIGETDPRILMSILRSWIKSPNQVAVQRAWATYVRLKYLLTSKMKMEDYDAVAGFFLKAQQTDLALAVFRDMILSGDPKAYEHCSVAIYKRTLKLSDDDLQSFKLASEELNWRSPKAFSVLPREKRNKFFYGSWMKKLIGDGEVDWAAQVAGLMCHRHIIPDPKHMNGVIGAWLRSGTAANQLKAEDLAWKMIGARLDFVAMRDQFGLQNPLRPMETSEKKAFDRPSGFSQVSTLATIETFCILVNFYQRRRVGSRVPEICAAIKAAKIKPNTAFLNDLILLGAMINRKPWTWNTYNEFVHVDGVAPDHDTFTVLWQMMKHHLKGKPKPGFPMPRTLFAEMARWPQARKKGILSREAYELILECFLLADDQIGTIIALRAMQHLFDLYPSEETVTNMVLQLAQTGHHKIRFPRRQERDQDMKSRTSQITEAANRLKEQRLNALLKEGIKFGDMDAITRAEEVIRLLRNLLRFAAGSRIVHPLGGGILDEGSNTSVQEVEQLAAEDMGVPQCGPIASSVVRE